MVIDFGGGAVLDRLEELGVTRITDVLLTHHHRDQVQGLARAAAAGARIWAPPFDAPLVADADTLWQSRPLDVDYDLREDRFSTLGSLRIEGTVPEYRSARFGQFDISTLPSPGHTPGSVTYLVELNGKRVAFVGDLLFGDGKVWSLAATQWSYTGVEGQEATIVSLAQLVKRQPDVLLPSHGGPIDNVEAAVRSVRTRLGELVAMRLDGEWGLEDRLRAPFDQITAHFWRNRSTFANSYVLVSETGAALGIDFGYDMATWRRPLLWSLDGLELDAVLTTHYHDDHVAGLNLLREVRGTEVWAPANVAPVLEEPHRYDLPCLWPEPTRVDRVLTLGEAFKWNEYELTTHFFPGHTLHAAAFELDVDGRRVLATGDQYAVGGDRTILNYQYRNRFRRRDFVQSAELVRKLHPDLIVSGHWLPHEVSEAYFDEIERAGKRLAALHDELLPEESFGEEGFGARIDPYRSTIGIGVPLRLEVTARNPFARAASADVSLVLPPGWTARPSSQNAVVEQHGAAVVTFVVEPAAERVRRARIGAELAVDGIRFGQQAEALVDIA